MGGEAEFLDGDPVVHFFFDGEHADGEVGVVDVGMPVRFDDCAYPGADSGDVVVVCFGEIDVAGGFVLVFGPDGRLVTVLPL